MKPQNNAKPGDYVEIELMKKIYPGVLLENPQNEKGIILLKLDSGYNIGLNKKDISSIKIKKKFSERKTLDKKVPINLKKPSIAMIILGGTISARMNPRKGGVDWLSKPEELLKYYPEIFEKVNVKKIEVPFMKASEDMDFIDWKKIASVAKNLLNEKDIKGIVITQGTDFLHYTSSALSFFLKDLNKPVVITYSQKSSDRASSDANLNLQCAALAAITDMAEVMVVGHASINDDFCYAIPGTKARKMHTSRRDAFKSVNAKPLAKIFRDKIEIISDYRVSNKKNKVSLDATFEPKVALIKIYPGQSPNILDFYTKENYRGLVLELSGLGHLPTKRSRNSWIKKLKDIQKKGVIICAASQTIYGRLNPLVYSNGREIFETGVIYLEDMLSETAFVKLSWILGKRKTPKAKNEIEQFRKWVKEKMLENFSHELNDRLEE